MLDLKMKCHTIENQMLFSSHVDSVVIVLKVFWCVQNFGGQVKILEIL